MDMTHIALARLRDYAEEMEHGIESAVLHDSMARAALCLARQVVRLSETGVHDSHQTQGGLLAVQRAVETARLTPRYPDAPWRPAA